MDIHILHFIVVPILLSILITSKSLAQETNTITTTENPLQACYKPYSCANCTAARICRPDPNGSGAFIDYKDFKCTGSTPFCNETTGTCSATPSEQCSVKVIGEHICMKNGVFPHPTTCRKYFQCENYTSTSFNCSSNNIYYDAIKEECTYNAWCNQVSCNGYNGFKRRYTVSNKVSQLFAYCINGQAAVMDRCDGKYVLNETTQMCEAYCSYPGLIEDISDCRKYYQCDPTSIDGVFLKTSRRCPDGFGFSQKRYQCVPIESWCTQSLTLSTTTPVNDVL
ncbi:hypothetical protein LSTR_LSTR008417 [Laodelphax striatellus]|uniref:Chitin-binding type-2 domain-containing protein n=1 Tax=Laodelphax striatellus TaxID=195883 RepID=A0A482XYP6_LAOST|nr:hypothetical protein LSTR_LSTR008417 [Laodelphax striatellus]